MKVKFEQLKIILNITPRIIFNIMETKDVSLYFYNDLENMCTKIEPMRKCAIEYIVRKNISIGEAIRRRNYICLNN